MTNSLPKNLGPFIWRFLKPHRLSVFIVVFLAIIAGFWGPFNSILNKYIINLLPHVQGGDVSILLPPISLIILNFIVFDNITWRLILYIEGKFTPVIINNIIQELMDHALGKSHEFYQENLSGKISKHITNLADGVEKLIGNVTFNFLRGISLLITAFIASYFVNPIFCLILITWFIVFASASLAMSKRFVALSDARACAESIVVGELVDCLSNHSNVRIFSGRAYEKLRLTPFLGKQQKAWSATYFYSLAMHIVQGGLIAIMMAVSCYFLAHLYGKNLVTVGDFALILGLSMETGHMMWFTMSEVDEFNKAVGRCKQSLISLIVPMEVQDKPGALPLVCDGGKITFDNVKFHYKGVAPLFENKSITIEAGQKVGLVGYSGSGKSTFVNLILRLYDITEGRILIDHQDIRDVTQDSLRRSISMISQDPSLFQRSLIDNIRYGKTGASDEEVMEAAKKAQAHDFIIKLPQGYNSLVGERGVKLSGGQRQRIAMARAFLKNAPILILDEATSQLDSVTEGEIQESLRELMKYKTTIVIAHRLSTLLHMDRIMVFDQGKIVDDGPHTQLINREGLYKTLWDTQVGGFLSDHEN